MALFSRLCCVGIESEFLEDKQRSKAPFRIFSLKELHEATNRFSYDNKLGEGSFGFVYRGRLWDGSQIAVKRLRMWSTRAEKEFCVEVETLASVRHKNLLSFRGYCAEGQERLIVYDFMPNLSLLSHLHGQNAIKGHLDWSRRMKIAIGSAEGLAYLHHHINPHIVHRDVKASNVLLDSNFEAQVADFGFAKLIPEGVSHVTTIVKGTVGYVAPEYALWGKVSESCDVYSFGILLLELISGKRPIERIGRRQKRTIVEWASPFVSEGRLDELVDSRLEGKFDVSELRRIVQAAVWCAQYPADQRPIMVDVVKLLRGGDHGLKPPERDLLTEKNMALDPKKYEDELVARVISGVDDYDDDDDDAQ